ncbi:hypothetical protein GN156_03215 [bacterium LRH843]|nr:hypothetical protein [bacterium LRH843]
MYLYLFPITGACLLFLILKSSLSLKLRIQFVGVATLLVYLSLLLFQLYTFSIAALAFAGLFLLFSLIIGKQIEYEMEEKRDVQIEYVNESVVDEKEIVLHREVEPEEEIVLEPVVQEETLEDEGESTVIHQEPELEDDDDFIRDFEERPRRMLVSNDENIEEEDSLLPREVKDDDLPIRVPYQTDGDIHPEVEKKQHDELLSYREKMFADLEENEKRSGAHE